jgi:uncharacterized protein (TIGR02996 family)
MSHDALLNAVLADPDADAPRLVLADYLDEHGNPDRAEFIRVQCELAGLDEADPRRPGLEDREHELLEAHEIDWFVGWQHTGGAIREWEWHRGFLRSATVASWFVGEGRPLFDHHPITGWRDETAARNEYTTDPCWLPKRYLTRLRVLDFAHVGITPAGLDETFGQQELARLRGIDLSHNHGISRLADSLARWTCRRELRSLAFGGRSGPNFQWADAANETLDVPAFVAAMADAPLEDLAAFDCGLTSDGLRELLAAFPRLRKLDVSDNPIAPDAYRAFERADRSLWLHALDVSGTPLAGISLEPLLHAPACEHLRELDMNRCGSARKNMEVVAASPFWGRATAFRAHGGTIPAFTLEPLCETAGPPALRLLDLADNYLRTAGVRLLCDAPWAGSLTWLALSRNYLDDDALAAIATSGRFGHLRTLHLAHNNLDQDRSEGEVITDASVRRLVRAAALPNLRVLTLSYTGVSDAAVDLVLNAPHWRLSGLGVGGCDLSPAAVATLAASPRLARLEWLDLSGNPRLSGDALMPLAESPYLSRRCELDVGGVYVGERTLAALGDRLGPRLSR